MSILLTEKNTSDIEQPNYVDPQTRVSLVLGLEIPFASIAVSIVLLRLYCRTFFANNLAADDWIMGISLLLSLTMTLTNSFSLLDGTGYHIINYPEAWVKPTGQYGTIAQALFGATISLTKTSILLFYHRHFPSKKVQFMVKLGIVFVLGWGISDLFGSIFECSPTTETWNPTNGTTDCAHDIRFLLATASLNTLSDFLILILPLSSLRKLRLSKRQWAAVLLIFGLGATSFILGPIRILLIILYSKSRDRPYDIALLYIVQAIESDLAIIAGSLPALQPLLPQIAKYRGRKPSVEYYRGGRMYEASLTGDRRSVISRTKPFLDEKPIHEEQPMEERQSMQEKQLRQEGQNDLSKGLDMVDPVVPTTEEPSSKPGKMPPSYNILHLNEPPGAPPNYPPPPILPERNPARIKASLIDMTVTLRTSPHRNKMTLFPPPETMARVRTFPKNPNGPVPKNDSEISARSTMWPTYGLPPSKSSVEAETRRGLPPKSGHRLPNFGSRETMWPAY